MKEPERKKKRWLQMKWLLKEDMAMKRMITLIVVCVVTFMFVCGLTGCFSGSEGAKNEKAAVCYVLTNTANSQGLNLNSPMVQDTIYDTIRNYGYISIVNADGILTPMTSMISTKVHPKRNLIWMHVLRLQI